MGLKSSKILGISVTTESKKDILEYIGKYLEKSSEKYNKPLVIVTPNPEQIVYARGDKRFTEIINRADVALPDGIGLALAMRRKRIPGVEMMEDIVKLASNRGYRIGLIGGRGGVAVRAFECLQARFQGVKGWAEEPGDVDPGNLGNLGELVEKIQKTNTKIVFVGLGAPKQEFFIEKLNAPVVMMAVGGAFDMIAGRIKRAPWISRGIGLEWLWRLIREPWRFRRQLALLKFLLLVLKKKE